jgi:hypothetical protein
MVWGRVEQEQFTRRYLQACSLRPEHEGVVDEAKLDEHPLGTTLLEIQNSGIELM